ncbi:protein grpE [Enterococcus moraviensis ATCC BAA-383]|uniref:Protein GrpE n=1 Tax=Enterococcus moraviensis ATCC BAA-383 TaxID=1158609 RepID=R2QZA8_9ENTE|nr:nucleotide exchange factor GrpE [Enterococcus moraviensis]EOI01880.1 protein grpE [Enterococcus moraviensis ATCC BAA-383]EOT73585.1 protein grpE [Enterococcus moraviensis ATCC BAA-383]
MSNKEETNEEIQEERTEAIDDSGGSETETEMTELEKAQADLSEMEDKFLRARAEIANMSNRFKNERELLVRYRSQDLGKKLLPSLDNLERAMAIEVDDEQGASLKKGISMVLESLQAALKEEGIEEIPTMGEVFDPNLHQAVQTIPASDETPADTIVEVLQKGYKLHDRVLRASMVIVAQ